VTWIGFAVLAIAAAHVVDVDPTPASGHLVLVVEGDAAGLRVTHITIKQVPYNPIRGLDRPWSVALVRGDGLELGRFPVDLSRFDLDPAHIGQPLRVEGDVVWDTKVATIVNVPWFADAEQLVFRSQERVLSTEPPESYLRMVRSAEIAVRDR
jgi:hypothetical protein